MVSPTKSRPFPAPPRQPSYVSVPNPADVSPDPNADPYANLASQNLPESAVLSPDPYDASQLFGNRRRSDYMPAPSVISRDSTHESLLAPGTPNLDGNRSSWGSSAGLAGSAEAIAGADTLANVPPSRRANAGRGQSNLAHSTLGWNNSTNDRLSTSDDDEQGHPTPAAAGAAAGALNEKSPRWASSGYQSKKSRKWLWLGIAAGALLAIALAVGLGVGLTQRSSHKATTAAAVNDNSGKSSSASSATSSAAPSATPTTGKTGSLIALDNGSSFTYGNNFGGSWVWDEANPFNNDAQCNSWTPPLNQNWTWGVDKIYGVNLGGWLNTEPFIVPALYEKYANGPNNQTAIDEYTLSQNMGANLTAALTEHYETFITEEDIANIAAAGLNWVRIPLPHWTIETWPGEPYLERVSWTYFLKAVQWCRKYGLRINLDFHTVPGSQNGWNHSGHQGNINWMYGIMGTANAQRALDYIRTLAQFIAQPEYSPVIQMFGFINEPNGNWISQPPIGSFYYQAYEIIREVTGIGEGNGPFLSMHDGFLGIPKWYGFLPGADRMAIDQHSYIVFGDQIEGTFDTISKLPCKYWGVATNTTSQQFGVNIAGEWSAATNDCGQWVNNVGVGSRYDGTYAGYKGPAPGTCDYWNDYTQWNASTKADLLHFVSASMDSLQNYFFWTWKIGNSTTGTIEQINPFWNYQLGLAQGWIPADPRSAIGVCAGDGYDSNEFSGTYSSAWMTGGAGANTIPAAMSASYPWPAHNFTNVAAADMTSLPQFTQTGTPITMPGPTFTSPSSSATINVGNGWFNANHNRQAFAAISGCSYPAEYLAGNTVPTSACGAGLTQPMRRNTYPAPTAPPAR